MSDQETSIPEQEPDQQISEEQNYQETMRGVRSFIGWHQVPELEVQPPLKMITPLNYAGSVSLFNREL